METLKNHAFYIEFFSFKSYYVVWKQAQLLIVYATLKSLNRTM